MKQIYAVLFVLSMCVLTVHAAAKTTKHTIKNGETLYSIAHQNHTTIEEVQKANHLKRGETLKVGRILIVPMNTYFPNKKKSEKVKQTFVKHKIKSGETLYDIAHANHTTISEVQKENHLQRGETLKVGRVLTVPKNTYFPDKLQATKIVHKDAKKKETYKLTKHRIQKGETLYSIAHNNHTTVAEVRKVNGLKKGETLKIGKMLKVPTNTYMIPNSVVPKVKFAKETHRKKILRVAKRAKKSHKKLVASLSKLETIALEKGTAYKKKKRTSFSLGDLIFSARGSNVLKSSKITSLAKKKLGRRYVWGATGQKNTFDCSGFTTYVYKKNGIQLPRRAIAQSRYGKFIPRNKLQKGDLIFFDTSKHRRGYVNHVGIYLGNGKFIHASSAKKKVVITSLNKRFYSQRYKGARRPS